MRPFSWLVNRIVCVVGLIAVGMVSPAPQAQSAGTPQSPQRPVFRSDAHFVLVDAYPLKDGKVVEGLTAGDFIVTEDGVPQRVELFEFVGGAEPVPESARRDPNTVGESREAVADPRARAFVTYLDIPHVSTAGAHRSRLPLVELLNELITPDDVFSVISSEHDVGSMTFARRITSFEDQLARYWAWGRRDSFEMTADESGLWSCFAYADPPGSKERFVKDGAFMRPLATVIIERHREDRLLAHLEDLVLYLGQLREGRTSVLLFSEGWRLLPRDPVLKAEIEKTGNEPPGVGRRGSQFDMFTTVAQGQRQACIQEGVRLADLDLQTRQRQLIELANSMNVSFFAVNPLGLAVFDRSIAEKPILADPTLGAGADDMDRVRARRETLVSLSHNTDGVAAVQSNDLRDAMRPIVDQLRSFYLLGYYSTNSAFDGKVRRISVSSPLDGLDIKARRSYRAPTAEERAARATAVAAPALDALARALDVLAGIRSADDRSFNAARYLTADAAPLLGAPAVFRATPSPRSPIVPVTAPVFRRTERVRAEWPILQALETRTARVVGRDGQPLAAQASLSERAGEQGGAPATLVVDVLLAALAPGDYAIELVVTGAGESKRTYVPFKVVP